MTVLFLMLFLQFGHPVLSDRMEVSSNPQITIQSQTMPESGIIDALVLEVTSIEGKFDPGPCNASLVVDVQTIALTCRVTGIGKGDGYMWSQLTIGSIDKISLADRNRILKANSVTMRAGRYKFKLTKSQLRLFNLRKFVPPTIPNFFNPRRSTPNKTYKARLDVPPLFQTTTSL